MFKRWINLLILLYGLVSIHWIRPLSKIGVSLILAQRFSNWTSSTTLLHLICTRFFSCKINCIKKIKTHFRIIIIRLIFSFVSFDRIASLETTTDKRLLRLLILAELKAYIKKTITFCSAEETCKHCTSNTTSLMS